VVISIASVGQNVFNASFRTAKSRIGLGRPLRIIADQVVLWIRETRRSDGDVAIMQAETEAEARARAIRCKAEASAMQTCMLLPRTLLPQTLLS
jgi:hypothetical protein